MTKLEEHTRAGGCHGPGNWTAPLCPKLPLWQWGTMRVCLDHRTKHHDRKPGNFYGAPIPGMLDLPALGL